MNIPENQPPKLVLDEIAILCLKETSRWAYVLSIIGFVGIGLMLLVGLFLGTAFDDMIGSVSMKYVSLVYVLFAAVYLIPMVHMYRFSIRMRYAINESNSEYLTGALHNLRSLFRFLGILTIAVIVLYLIFFVSAILFGIFRSL